MYERSLTQAHNFKRKVSQLDEAIGSKALCDSAYDTTSFFFHIHCSKLERNVFLFPYSYTAPSLNEKRLSFSILLHCSKLERNVFLFPYSYTVQAWNETSFFFHTLTLLQAWSSVRVWKKKDVSFKLGAV